MVESRSNLHKYSMHFGTYMGVYWILTFILFPIALSIPFIQFIVTGLTFGVPFLGYYYVKTYRDKVCDGEISFRNAWAFIIFMYMFASLLAAVIHFIYFKFIDHGFVINEYTKLLNQYAANQPKEVADLIDQMIANLYSMTPIDITLQMLSSNMFVCGILLGIPTALFAMKRKRKPQNTNESQENN